MARSGHGEDDIPDIVRALISEVEERGLDVPNIYQKTGAKSQVREVIKSFDQLEEIDLTNVSIHAICNALRSYWTSESMLSFERFCKNYLKFWEVDMKTIV